MFVIVASDVLTENITLIIRCIKEFELTELAGKFMEINYASSQKRKWKI